jgi:tetratricopeptide (TPR) repeat protein
MAPDDAFPQAKAAALKALELDDSLAQVHELMGNTRRHYDWDWNGAESAFREAVRIDPNYADGHFMYADLLVSMGAARGGSSRDGSSAAAGPPQFSVSMFSGLALDLSGPVRRCDRAVA